MDFLLFSDLREARWRMDTRNKTIGPVDGKNSIKASRNGEKVRVELWLLVHLVLVFYPVKNAIWIIGFWQDLHEFAQGCL